MNEFVYSLYMKPLPEPSIDSGRGTDMAASSLVN